MGDAGHERAPDFGELLRRYRLTAGLSQEVLAERARLSPYGISALERGYRRTPRRETLELLVGALALSDEDREAFETAARAASARRRDGATIGPWRGSDTVLPVAPTAFVGREAELAALGAALDRDGAAALYGLGGVGKSSLAREYAARNRDKYSVILWLDAQTEDGIIDGLLAFGATFVRGLDQIANRRMAAQRVVNSVLSGLDKSPLLIFDNLEEERHLRAWLPRDQAHALITSRNAMPNAGIPATFLQVWSLETAVEYLGRASGRTDISEADARAIAQTLEMLPLALSHAAASLRTMRMLTPERYLKHITAHLKDAPLGVEYPQSVFATFKTAIAQAEHEAAGAAAAVCFASSFAPDAIPDELFRQPVEKYAAGLPPTLAQNDVLDLRSLLADEVRLDAVLGVLDRISLLVYSETSQTYSIHRLVQLAAQDLVSNASRSWRECAVRVIDAAFPPQAEFAAAWPACGRLLPHVRAAIESLASDAVFLPAASVATRCSVYLLERGEYDLAERLQKYALSIQQKALGSDNPEVARSSTRLANVYFYQGRYDEAETLYVRALEIRQNAFGPDHYEISNNLNNLAMLRQQQARYDEAKALYMRALAIKEKALGRDHTDVALSLSNLAGMYVEQARYDEAAPLLERAVLIREESLSPDEPGLAMSLNNLAIVRSDQRRYDESEALLSRALAIAQKTLGSDHPHVAHILNNLANLYHEQARYDESERLHARALAIWENTQVPDHPNVATALYDLGRLYDAQGRAEDANRLYVRALAIRNEALGPDHPETAAVREKLEGAAK